jgi:hypothetical protein
MHGVVIAIVIAWAVFWIYWLLSALAAKPEASTKMLIPFIF